MHLALVAVLLVTGQAAGSPGEPELLVLVDQRDRPVEMPDGTFVRGRDQWVRSEQDYRNFVLTFDVSLQTPDSEASVTVRAVKDARQPARGERIRFQARGLSPASRWERVRVQAEGGRLGVQVDDALAGTRQVDERSGAIVFEVGKGSVRFRNVRISRLDRAVPSDGKPLTKDELKILGGQAPRVLRDVKPSYTANAMAAGVRGTVRLEAVVLTDGTVANVRVTHPLHKELDSAAVQAMRGFVFVPAMLNGAAVPSIVEVDMTFTLK